MQSIFEDSKLNERHTKAMIDCVQAEANYLQAEMERDQLAETIDRLGKKIHTLLDPPGIEAERAALEREIAIIEKVDMEIAEDKQALRQLVVQKRLKLDEMNTEETFYKLAGVLFLCAENLEYNKTHHKQDVKSSEAELEAARFKYETAFPNSEELLQVYGELRKAKVKKYEPEKSMKDAKQDIRNMEFDLGGIYAEVARKKYGC